MNDYGKKVESLTWINKLEEESEHWLCIYITFISHGWDLNFWPSTDAGGRYFYVSHQKNTV